MKISSIKKGELTMTTETKTTKTAKGISRRSLLKTGAAAFGAMAGSGVITGFPSRRTAPPSPACADR